MHKPSFSVVVLPRSVIGEHSPVTSIYRSSIAVVVERVTATVAVTIVIP